MALPDANERDKGGAIMVVAGLDRPHGLAWKNGDLYVAETGRVLRFRYDPATRKATSAVVVGRADPPDHVSFLTLINEAGGPSPVAGQV